jgi:CRISPR-associated protein Csm1
MNEKEAIVLGALLHDIGKFAQRANVNCKYKNDESEMQRICPFFKERSSYSHKHVLWTSSFLEDYSQWLPDPLSGQQNPEDNYFNFARQHHKPNTPLQWLVTEADRLSSGMDRKERDIDDEIFGRDAYKNTPLKSIFEEITLGNHQDRNKFVYPLSKLSATNNDFPRAKDANSEGLIGKYQSLWKGFEAGVKNLPRHDFIMFYNALLSLLEQCTWAIPSSTVDQPDISLYDHSITTAAIAAALYQYHVAYNNLSVDSVRDKITTKFILVSGDLSGIQSYIFNLTRSNVHGVSKILRARSFYVGLLADLWSHEIIERLKLFSVNKIISAGGHFVILAPNTHGVVQVLTQIKKEIDKFFLNHFNGELVLNLNWDTTLCGADFQQEKFPTVIGNIVASLEKAKLQKLDTVLDSPESFVMRRDYENFDPDQGLCSICGTNPANRQTHLLDENEAASTICSMCDLQIQLGGYLPDTKYIGYARTKTGADREIPVIDDRFFVSFLRGTAEIKDNKYFLLESIEDDGEFPRYTRRYLANYIPKFSSEDISDLALKNYPETVRPGAPKTFDCIALAAQSIDEKQKPKGRAMLGVLKADVDRLGMIFGVGLTNNISVSRYTFLSRMMNLYFCGYLQNVLKHDSNYRDIYTVYAGGDDLFLIGPWTQIVSFAKQIHDSFRAYTCHNQDITISAGINFIRPRYPINRAAEIADRFLDQAKEAGRDRIRFFNTTIPWSEFDKYINFGKYLDEKINDKKSSITDSFVYRLLVYHKMALAAETDVRNLKYHALFNYDMGRNILKKDSAGAILNPDEIEKLQEIVELSSPLIKGLKIPISYAMYKNRRQV